MGCNFKKIKNLIYLLMCRQVKLIRLRGYSVSVAEKIFLCDRIHAAVDFAFNI
jgi:hypothetical protein